MIKEDLLKRRPENGEENYTLNFKKECRCSCSKKGITIIKKEDKR